MERQLSSNYFENDKLFQLFLFNKKYQISPPASSMWGFTLFFYFLTLKPKLNWFWFWTVGCKKQATVADTLKSQIMAIKLYCNILRLYSKTHLCILNIYFINAQTKISWYFLPCISILILHQHCMEDYWYLSLTNINKLLTYWDLSSDQ